MNTQSNPMAESFASPVAAPSSPLLTRPFYWSVRRELWENRSIYLAPLGVAGVFLIDVTSEQLYEHFGSDNLREIQPTL